MKKITLSFDVEMKKISLQEIYDKYSGKVAFPDTCNIFFYVEEEKE